MNKLRIARFFGAFMVASACSIISRSAVDDATPVLVDTDVTVQEQVQPTSQPPTPEPVEAPPPADPIETLVVALHAKDYATLQGLMTNPFMFAPIASEPVSYTPADFMVQLQTNYLGPGSVTVDLNREIRSEVNADYANLLNSYANVLYSEGWGSNGTDGALLLLDSDGRWTSILYILDGLETLMLDSVQSGDAAFTSFSEFRTAFLEALTSGRDYAVLQSMMGDPFVIGFWQSEGVELTPLAATEQLRSSYLTPATFVTYRLDADLTGRLGGIDPLTMWNPDVNVVSALISSGWGTDGNGEAVLVIALRDDGTYYWYSMLYAPLGF